LPLHLTKNDGSRFQNARKESGLESAFERTLEETILANAHGEKTLVWRTFEWNGLDVVETRPTETLRSGLRSDDILSSPLK
jgi:hypothetical protein